MVRNEFTALGLILSTAVYGSAHAADCVTLEPDVTVPGLPTDADGIRLVGPNVSAAVPNSTPSNGVWTVTKAQVDMIKGMIGGQPGKDFTLRPAKGATPMAGVTIPFAVPPDKCAVGTPSLARQPATASTVDAATPEQCFREAEKWALSSGRYRQPVLFNSKGAHCYSPPVLRQGDLLVVGMVLAAGEKAPEANAEFNNCTPEDPTPKIFSSGELPADLIQQSATKKAETIFLAAMPCATQAPVVTVKLGTGEDAVSSPHTLSQFPRYQATFHLGAVYTDLHEPDFGVRDNNGTQVVYNKDATDRGPEYVVTVVVQGVFHYFEKLRSTSVGSADLPNWRGVNNPDNWPYKGRDPVHDGKTLDRIGLVLSAGLKNPGDRFGVGLSYEIARGINVVGLYEMARIEQLDGLKAGDAFAGAADALPVSRRWESKASLGMTFDLAYVTKLFSR